MSFEVAFLLWMAVTILFWSVWVFGEPFAMAIAAVTVIGGCIGMGVVGVFVAWSLLSAVIWGKGL